MYVLRQAASALRSGEALRDRPEISGRNSHKAEAPNSCRSRINTLDFIYNIVEVDCFQPLTSKDGKPIESVSCLAQSSNCRPLLTTFTATSFNPISKQRKHRRQ